VLFLYAGTKYDSDISLDVTTGACQPRRREGIVTTLVAARANLNLQNGVCLTSALENHNLARGRAPRSAA
jgi:hypothetical protein